MPDAPHDTLGPFGCQDTPLTHIRFAINLNPQISFPRASLQPLLPQFVGLTGITPSKVQNSALAHVKFDMTGDCPVVYSDLSARPHYP